METSGFCTLKIFELSGDLLHAAKEKYHSVVNFVEENLVQEITPCRTPHLSRPGLIFYISSLFAYSIVDGLQATTNAQWITTDIPFRSMCSAIHIYRQRSIDLGIVDSTFQDLLQGNILSRPSPFSTSWSDKLTDHKLPESSSHHPSSLLSPARDDPNGVA